MRKFTALILIIILAFAVVIPLFGIPQEPELDAGRSELFSEDEIYEALLETERTIRGFHGCRLYALSYAGDERSLAELKYYDTYDEVIDIDSRFRSPLIGGGGWNSDSIYTWHFILGRNGGEKWEMISYGYC